MEEIVGKVADTNKNIIVIFVNSKYTQKVYELVDSFQKFKIDNYLFVVMDNELFMKLKADLINSFFYPLDVTKNVSTRQNLWINRTKFIYDILKHGYNVLHMDADVNIFRDPFEKLNEFTNTDVDIICTHGTIWPPSIFKQWRFVVRCGFIMYNSTEETLRFFEEFIEKITKTKDDQIALNHLLYDKNVKWDIQNNKDYLLKFRHTNIRCFYEPLFGTTNNELKIVILPHRFFPRAVDRNEKCPYVVDYV